VSTPIPGSATRVGAAEGTSSWSWRSSWVSSAWSCCQRRARRRRVVLVAAVVLVSGPGRMAAHTRTRALVLRPSSGARSSSGALYSAPYSCSAAASRAFRAPAVGPVDLDSLQAVGAHEPGQPSAVGAGAFHPDALHRPEAFGPGDQGDIAAGRGRERLGGKQPRPRSTGRARGSSILARGVHRSWRRARASAAQRDQRARGDGGCPDPSQGCAEKDRRPRPGQLPVLDTRPKQGTSPVMSGPGARSWPVAATYLSGWRRRAWLTDRGTVGKGTASGSPESAGLTRCTQPHAASRPLGRSA
jgi:hypothetical protein